MELEERLEPADGRRRAQAEERGVLGVRHYLAQEEERAVLDARHHLVQEMERAVLGISYHLAQQEGTDVLDDDSILLTRYEAMDLSINSNYPQIRVTLQTKHGETLHHSTQLSKATRG